MTIGHLWHYPTPIKRVVCQDFGPVQELSYNKPALRADDTSNVGREEVQTLLRCWMKTNGLNLESDELLPEIEVPPEELDDDLDEDEVDDLDDDEDEDELGRGEL